MLIVTDGKVESDPEVRGQLAQCLGRRRAISERSGHSEVRPHAGHAGSDPGRSRACGGSPKIDANRAPGGRSAWRAALSSAAVAGVKGA